MLLAVESDEAELAEAEPADAEKSPGAPAGAEPVTLTLAPDEPAVDEPGTLTLAPDEPAVDEPGTLRPLADRAAAICLTTLSKPFWSSGVSTEPSGPIRSVTPNRSSRVTRGAGRVTLKL